MSEKPILDALRAILKFRNKASIGEIARMAGKSQRRVLDVLNDNKALIVVDREAGNVLSEKVRDRHRHQEMTSGRYYFMVSYGQWAPEGYALECSDPELMARMADDRHENGKPFVRDTPQNRAELEAHGLRLWVRGAFEPDDRLWKEE